MQDDRPSQVIAAELEVVEEIRAIALERGNLDAALKASKDCARLATLLAEREEGLRAAAIVDPVERLRALLRLAAAKGSAGPARDLERDLRELLAARAEEQARAQEAADAAATPDATLDDVIDLLFAWPPHIQRYAARRLLANAPAAPKAAQ